jgi:hypothetical protein
MLYACPPKAELLAVGGRYALWFNFFGSVFIFRNPHSEIRIKGGQLFYG